MSGHEVSGAGEAPDSGKVDRRTALKWVGAGLASAAAGALLIDRAVVAIDNDRETPKDPPPREYAQQIFALDAMGRWSEFSIVPDLLQIDPSVRVSKGIFESPVYEIDSTPGGFLVACMPLIVKNTLIHHASQYDQARIDEALEDIPEGMLAFYTPNFSSLVYMDADANDGLVELITNDHIVGHRLEEGLGGADGHYTENRLQVPYYTQQGGWYGANADYTGRTIAQPQGVSFLVPSALKLDEVTEYYTSFGANPAQFVL